MSRGQIRWITIDTLHLLHHRQIELFGGADGVRDVGAIESALARPLNAFANGEAKDIETLAACYLCGLSRQQGYLDGNKRTALGAMLVFLSMNGRKLVVPAPELYGVVIAAATNTADVTQVAAWVKKFTTS